MLAKSIIQELKELVGKDRCLTAPEDLMVYSHDAFAEKKADVVVLPTGTEEVSRILKLANRERIPVTPRGSATGLSGMCTPERGGIVMAMSKMNKILEVSPEDSLAVVEPGVITNDLQIAAEAAGVFYPPDPASQTICQIGGNVATNAGGPRCVKYGVTRDYLLGLEAVLPSGEVIKTGGRPIKNVTGYDVTRLLCGSEGTLAVFTKIIVKLIAKPEARRTLLVAFRSIDDASTTVSRIMAAGIVPRALELMDQHYIRNCENIYKLGLPMEAAAMLIIEVDGFVETVDRQARIAKEFCEAQKAFDIKLAKTEEEADRLWMARKVGSVALFRVSKMVDRRGCHRTDQQNPGHGAEDQRDWRKIWNDDLPPGPRGRREHASSRLPMTRRTRKKRKESKTPSGRSLSLPLPWGEPLPGSTGSDWPRSLLSRWRSLRRRCKSGRISRSPLTRMEL